MSISGKQTINIGLPNESANSDSLYTAFNKANTNFNILFACASPFNTFNSSDGIQINANSSTGAVTITNTGVTNIIAGTGITIDRANGNVTISSNGGGNGGGGTVTSVGIVPISTSRLAVTGSPIVSSGTMTVDLAPSGVTSGVYSNPNITIDQYGRVTAAANGSITGTVTSVGLTPGPGVQINGGPITSNGNITVTNTGVLRLNAGSGIQLSSGNGNVTISASTSSGTVTAVTVTSSQLVITGSPIVTAGIIGINLPSSVTFSGNVTAGGIKTNNLYYANGSPWDLQEAAGSTNQIQFNNSNNFAASSNLTFNPSTNVLNVTGNITSGNVYANTGTIGALTLKGEGGNISNIQGANVSGAVSFATTANSVAGANVTGTVANATYAVTSGSATTSTTAGTVTTNAQPNITSVGTLTSVDVTGNVTAGNLVLTTGNIIYTPRYGAFYSNVTQNNPVANTAMAMTFNNTTNANGVSVVAGTQLTVDKAGIYNIQFSAQLTKTDAGSDYIEIWIAKNGTAVPWTNTLFKLDGSNTYQLATLNLVESLNAGEYVELMWGSADINAKLITIPSVNTTMGIDVPSVIVTVVPVGA